MQHIKIKTRKCRSDIERIELQYPLLRVLAEEIWGAGRQAMLEMTGESFPTLNKYILKLKVCVRNRKPNPYTKEHHQVIKKRTSMGIWATLRIMMPKEQGNVVRYESGTRDHIMKNHKKEYVLHTIQGVKKKKKQKIRFGFVTKFYELFDVRKKLRKQKSQELLTSLQSG